MIHVKIITLTAFIAIVSGVAYGADPSARDLVEKSIFNHDNDWSAALDFTYRLSDVTASGAGEPKTTEVSQISVLNGTPYTRLVGKNGSPLTPEEARREDEKFQKAAAVRDRETAEQRARRIRKYQEECRFLREIPDAFEMKLLGHETIEGRPNYVVELAPRAGFVPQSKGARMFPYIEGKLWIDEQDMRWTKAEANVVDTISIGWVLARIGPGAHITMKQVKVDGEHWMPKEITVNGLAKIMLVRNRPINEVISYSDYRRIGRGGTAVAARNEAGDPGAAASSPEGHVSARR